MQYAETGASYITIPFLVCGGCFLAGFIAIGMFSIMNRYLN